MFLVLIAIEALAAVWNGYVLSILWAWFVTTTFGLHPLTLAPAIGLSCVVSLLVYHTPDLGNDEDEYVKKLIEKIVSSFVIPLTLLLTGWITHLCM